MDDIWGKKEVKPATETGTMDGWGKKATPTIAASGSVAPPAEPNGVPAAVVNTSLSRDGYWANKEARDLEKERIYREEDIPAIRRTSAYSAAATLAAAALANEAIGFGSAAKGKRLDMYLGFVDHIAQHVYDRLNEGFGVAEASEDAVESAQEEILDGE